MSKTLFTTPATGRLIMGDVYELRVQQDENTGLPKKIKTGANQGQDLKQRFIAIAIPKTAATLAQEPWYSAPTSGQTVSPSAAAQAAWPAGQWQWPAFASKIVDGDLPNTKNEINPNARGCWVVKGQTSGVIKVYSWVNGTLAPNDTPGLIKCGDYVQVQFEYTSNTSDKKPGMYCTPTMVCFTRAGDKIEQGVPLNPTAAGFAQGEALPGTATPASTGFAAPAPSSVAAAPAPGAIAPVAGFNNGTAGMAPPPPPAAPVPEQRRLQDGRIVTRDELIGWNWTPAQIDQHTTAV
jgi:hypothetical protein